MTKKQKTAQDLPETNNQTRERGAAQKRQEQYRAPELHDLGTIHQVQGRNYYSDHDLGNCNYYI